ncbi:MAG: hypothetical protein IJ776_06025 [Paludibacteraceae bacterium]|nr:hypothetical protein [Paludibacteraceae bacterium]
MNKHYLYILLAALLAWGCEPEAKWEEKNIEITMDIQTVSAGYVECNFSTNKDAYYLIAIEQANDDYDPMQHQKQFMMLALDSANLQYMAWRNLLLKEGEFNIAPFASHSLQYGTINKFFTGLIPDEDYWIYAFAVNPETLQPVSKLYLQRITTTEESVVDVHFEYRVKGRWDYIYPVDSEGNILTDFPYVATTRDSIVYDATEITAPEMLIEWMLYMFIDPESATPYYGVQAIENDGEHSHLYFEEGHTYYTGICGFDGPFKQATIYKFRWNGEDTEYYFYDTDEANIAKE